MRRGIEARYTIPYEHATKIERMVNILREKMRSTAHGLAFKLSEPHEEYLGSSVVQAMNDTPNSKSIPHTPSALMKGVRPNYQTDYHAPFGSVALCSQSGVKAGTSENKHDIGVSLGRAPNHTGGHYFAIPGYRDPVIRRALKGMDWNQALKDFMNQLADAKPGSDLEQLLFYNEVITPARQTEMEAEQKQQEETAVNPTQIATPVEETLPVQTDPINELSAADRSQDVQSRFDQVSANSEINSSNADSIP